MPKPINKRVISSPQRYLTNPSFSQWLYYQQERGDSVGGLAQFAFADRTGDMRSCWPMAATTAAHLIMHLRLRHAQDKNIPEEIAIRNAFDEFRRFLRSDGKVPARSGGVKRSERPNTHRGYVIPPETVVQIKEIAEMENLTQGEVLQRIVATEHKRVAAHFHASDAGPVDGERA